MNKREVIKESNKMGKVLSWTTLIVGALLIVVNMFVAAGFVLGMIFALIVAKKHLKLIEELK